MSDDAGEAPGGDGEAPRLSHVLQAYHLLREPLPDFVLRELVRALQAYESGAIGADELLQRLGVHTAASTRTERRRTERLVRVQIAVERAHDEGAPKSNPATSPDTAFHRAAAALGMPVSTVFDVYRGKR